MNHFSENNQADKQLVDKVLHGDTRAFEAIIKLTEPLVAGIVVKMVRNAADRQDLAQDIYLKAFHKLSGFRFQSRLSTWIGQIAYNTCFNYLEKKKPVLWHEEFNTIPVGDDSPDPETKWSRKQLAELIKTEIDDLSPVHGTLIELYHTQELSYNEIAQIMQLPEGTVKSYLFRARKTLKEKLLIKYKREAL